MIKPLFLVVIALSAGCTGLHESESSNHRRRHEFTGNFRITDIDTNAFVKHTLMTVCDSTNNCYDLVEKKYTPADTSDLRGLGFELIQIGKFYSMTIHSLTFIPSLEPRAQGPIVAITAHDESNDIIWTNDPDLVKESKVLNGKIFESDNILGLFIRPNSK